MKYIDHEGKERRVSDKRFQEYLNDWCNEPTWLEFRVKKLEYPKEDLIMHPLPYMYVFGKDRVAGGIRWCGLAGGKNRGKFFGGGYCDKKTEKIFDTPEEAYDYAYNLDLGVQK